MPWRLQCYRSKGVLDGAHLRLYFLQKPAFPAPAGTGTGKPTVADLCDPRCLTSTAPALLEMYQR